MSWSFQSGMTAIALIRPFTDSLRIAFMGTPDFAVPALETLVQSGLKPVVVVTGPDKPRGRGRLIQPTAVKLAAQRLGITTILQPASVKNKGFAHQLFELGCDIQVVVAFRILPRAVFTAARLGSFNLHASLLPRYRGAAPINRALMAGEKVTGVTTFFLKEKVDTGNVILQWPTLIGPNETAGELHNRLALLGARAIVETTRRIATGRTHAIRQNDASATSAPKIFRDDCRIPWAMPAPHVHNHCRGLSPFPGAWTLWKGKQLKVLRTQITCGHGEPGRVLKATPRLVVACRQSAIEVQELQLEGQRRMPAAAFVRGRNVGPGTQLV